MAIDLPPALPPVLTSSQQISSFSEVSLPYARKLGQYEIRLTGNHGLSAGELDALFVKAQTPSQLILMINSASYNNGNLLVRLLYSAPANNVVYLHAVQMRVGEIRGNEVVKRHFKDLAGDVDLTREEFSTRQVLADIQSERSGLDYSVSYEASPERPDALDLVFNQTADAEHDATDFIVQLGNQGSRFAGRYFLDLGFKHNFSSGFQLSGGYEHAISDWGESRDGEDYHQFQLKLDKAYSFGLYGIEGRHSQYVRDLGVISVPSTACVVPSGFGGLLCLPTASSTQRDVELDAEIDQLAITGNQVISSDIDHRFTLSQRLDYTDSLIDSNIDQVVQDERYATLEVGATYHKAKQHRENLLNWKLGAAIKGGISGDKGTLGTDSQSAGMAVGKRTAEFVVIKPKAEAIYAFSANSNFRLALNAQLSDEQLPQQQQWVLGGVDRLSAYLPGVLVGDSGYHADLSFNHTWKLGDFSLAGGVFAEYGAAQYENASGALGSVDLGDQSSIADAGIRATLSAWDWLEVRAVIAESLSEDNVDEAALDRAEADFFVVVKAIF
ncbi:ShlB/FhaC/HecB family hemolysin secretion/activation protein [Litorivivens sp.]|uniref:ShlB/FhaC/HecB family hemolysin secretion/activation protein n=2 Tax=Litorivivens sp. TaxID=2020868 RepID=UPI003564662F